MTNPINHCCLPNVNEALNNFANSMTKIMQEALAEKDKTIQELSERIKVLETTTRVIPEVSRE